MAKKKKKMGSASQAMGECDVTHTLPMSKKSNLSSPDTEPETSYSSK